MSGVDSTWRGLEAPPGDSHADDFKDSGTLDEKLKKSARYSWTIRKSSPSATFVGIREMILGCESNILRLVHSVEPAEKAALVAQSNAAAKRRAAEDAADIERQDAEILAHEELVHQTRRRVENLHTYRCKIAQTLNSKAVSAVLAGKHNTEQPRGEEYERLVEAAHIVSDFRGTYLKRRRTENADSRYTRTPAGRSEFYSTYMLLQMRDAKNVAEARSNPISIESASLRWDYGHCLLPYCTQRGAHAQGMCIKHYFQVLKVRSEENLRPGKRARIIKHADNMHGVKADFGNIVDDAFVPLTEYAIAEAHAMISCISN
jgi:hypothetical protein